MAEPLDAESVSSILRIFVHIKHCILMLTILSLDLWTASKWGGPKAARREEQVGQ